MNKQLVMTLTGPDRVGLVEHITKRVLEFNGNVEDSRMAQLGGVFAILIMISVPESKLEGLQDCLTSLREDGFKVTTAPAEEGDSTKYSGWIPCQIEVNGADHEGIVHTITRQLATLGVNIESMDTHMIKAPMSGTPLFMMKAVILVPPAIKMSELIHELKPIGDDLNVDVEIEPFKC
ncbi:transcriptional regulator [candidate division KSB1 bacterium]|nr:transcriptional regulator [candidate division KSB1 bacterium]